MDKFLLFSLYLLSFLSTGLITSSVFAQPLTGVKTIPGDYATIEIAINALNSDGVGDGGITFNVAAGHTETFSVSSAGTLTATGTLTAPILFQKSGGGANPLITAALNGVSITNDGIIILSGGDYITFDGISLQENPANLTATTQMEWGYALVKKSASAPFDGCQNIIIKNASITLNKSNVNSTGIYSGNHTATATTALTITDPSDASNNCKFYGNNISNVFSGIKLNGFLASSPYTLYDQNNEVGVEGGNVITNFAGSTTVTSYGIYAAYQNNIKIANNNINGGTGHTYIFHGINTSTGINSNVDIYNNTITLNPGVTTNYTGGIYSSMGGTGTSNTVNIYNNILENCTFTAATSSVFYGIYQTASAYIVNMHGNIVRNNTKPGSGLTYLLYNSAGAANGVSNVYNNQVYNNSNSGTGTLYGLYANPGNQAASTIYDNNIYNNSGGSSIVYGLYSAGVTATANIFNNSISNLTTTHASGVVHGIYAAAAVTINIYNNFISDLKATASTNSNAVIGLNIISGTNLGVYYNTIFLNAVSSSATTFGSSGIYTATSPVLDMRNNIIVNKSASGPTGGFTSAYRRNGTSLINYSNESNNNAFYAGTPAANRLIFYDGTNSDLTLSAYKTRVAPRDAGSVTEDVPFINTSTAPFNVHVRTDFPTQTEGGGLPVNSPIIISTDYDGNLRNENTPDIGADEFNGISYDITPPSINYTLLTGTSITSHRLFTGVTINDASGVNTSPGTAPRVYFKRLSDDNTFVDNTPATIGWKYAETNSPGSPFSFSIDYSKLFGGSGVTSGNTIQYFVVAQDLGVPTVGIYSGAFTNSPLSVNLTPAAFPITGIINSYNIIPSIGGIVTVGTGGTYPDLTGDGGLFANINSKVVNSNITALIISDLAETGVHALNQWIEEGTGNYTLTIQPDTDNLKVLSGSYAGGLIRLNGADNVTIDGRFMGNGQYLKIVNTATTGTIATIQLISLGTDAGATNNIIRNCIINAGHHTATSTSISVGGAVNAAGNSNHNIQILNNSINRAYQGIYVGSGATGMSNGLIISGNLIGSKGSDTVAYRGIILTGVSSPEISGNEISNMSVYTAVHNAGIDIGSQVTNALISRNKIYGIRSWNAAGSGAYGINIAPALGTSDIMIVNNMIFDISADGVASNNINNPFGIRIAGGANIKIFNNSVNMFGTFLAAASSSADMSAALIVTSTSVSGIDIRNNIFTNSMTGPSATTKAYAVYVFSGVVVNTINKNNYYVSGPYGILGYFGSDKLTLTAWKTATGQDLYSQNVDPMYVSNTDLHLNTGLTPTVLESGGDLIPGIINDFDGDVRPGPAGSVNGGATKPDIGADEFDGVPAVPMSYVSSTVTQNNLNHLIKNTVHNEIIGIQIVTSGAADPLVLQNLALTTTGTTDINDIRNAKIWYTGTNPSFVPSMQYGSTLIIPSSGFNISGSLPLLNGTNYFWLTFDIVPEPTGGNTVDAQCTQVTINDQIYTPVITDPPGNRTILGLLSGNYNVGSGGHFVTITSAVQALNGTGINGAVVFNLTDDLYSTSETFPIVINQVDGASSINSITLKPAVNVNPVISGSASSIIKLNGADYIIIDGNNGNNDRNLTIQNNSTSTNSGVVWLSSPGDGSGSQNNTIKNCNIIAGSNSVTSTFGIILSGTSISTTGTGAHNNDNLLQNNNIQKAYYGIYARGVAATGQISGLNITGNIIGSDNQETYITYRGVDIQNADAPLVSQNVIFNLKLTTSSSPAGIDLGLNVADAIVERNMLYGMQSSSTTLGYGAYGINIGSSTSNISIQNNIIYDIRTVNYSASSTIYNAFGIRITGGTNHKIYYNSVNLYGPVTIGSNIAMSACFVITSNSVTGMDLRNNIFSNSSEFVSSSSKAYAAYIVSGTTFAQINHNDYYTGGAFGVLGYYGADKTDLISWQAASGQDLNSISALPMFISDTNLHMYTMASPVVSAGVMIPGVIIDYDGEARGYPPCMGADEFDEGMPFPLIVNVQNGWNMVSIPGLHPVNQNVLTWWEGKDPQAAMFGYAGGYNPVDVLTPGQGYWLKNLGANTYNTGDEWPEINIIPNNPLNGAAGWNMIGGYHNIASVSAITTNPPNAISAAIFGYSNGYQQVTELVPGYGYWLKLSQAAQIILPSGSTDVQNL
jgi:hypothetical protein